MICNSEAVDSSGCSGRFGGCDVDDGDLMESMEAMDNGSREVAVAEVAVNVSVAVSVEMASCLHSFGFNSFVFESVFDSIVSIVFVASIVSLESLDGIAFVAFNTFAASFCIVSTFFGSSFFDFFW